MATILSNSNFYVRWDKTDCDNYTITNLLSYATVDVTISDELSDWEESFSLEFNGENTIILPADGVYKICATSSADAFNDIYTAQPALTLSNSVVNIGPMTGAGDAFISRIRVVGQGNIYQSDPPPLQDNDWSNPPSSYSNVGIAVNNWLAANGGGFFEIIAPGQQSATFPWVPVDATNYQVAFFSQNNYEIEYIGTTQWNDVSVPTQFLHFPDVDCIVSWAPDLENLDPPREYVISFILDGQNILTEPVFIGDQAGIDNFFDIVQTWLNENGGGIILDRENLWFVFDNCATPGALTLANVLPSNEQCDYIYELCDTYACIARLVQQWLCNPCPDKCDPNYVEAKEARQRAI